MDFTNYIDDLLDPNKSIIMSKLVNLSGITGSDLKIFNDQWKQTGNEKRRQIINKLYDLAESNPELDFDEIFKTSLQDPDPMIRVKALEALEESEDFHILEAVIKLMKNDPESSVRSAAAELIENFSLLAELNKLPSGYGKKIGQALIETIKSDADANVRRRALEAISPLNLPEVEVLIKNAYNSEDIQNRCSAIYAMGKNCNLKWLPTLIKELCSNNPEIRFNSVNACGEIGDESAVSAIIKVLNDPDIEVRMAAITALGELGGTEAKNALLMCLETEDESIKKAVEEALSLVDFYQEPFSLSM